MLYRYFFTTIVLWIGLNVVTQAQTPSVELNTSAELKRFFCAENNLNVMQTAQDCQKNNQYSLLKKLETTKLDTYYIVQVDVSSKPKQNHHAVLFQKRGQSAKRIYDFYGQSYPNAYFIEKEQFHAIYSNPKYAGLVQKFIYNGQYPQYDKTTLKDILEESPTKVVQVSPFEKSSFPGFCSSVNAEGDFYEYRTFCVTQKPLLELYHMLAQELNQEYQTKMMHLKLPVGKSFHVDCPREYPCVAIDYQWKSANHLTVDTMWDGGQTIWVFEQNGDKTTLEKIHYRD